MAGVANYPLKVYELLLESDFPSRYHISPLSLSLSITTRLSRIPQDMVGSDSATSRPGS